MLSERVTQGDIEVMDAANKAGMSRPGDRPPAAKRSRVDAILGTSASNSSSIPPSSFSASSVAVSRSSSSTSKSDRTANSQAGIHALSVQSVRASEPEEAIAQIHSFLVGITPENKEVTEIEVRFGLFSECSRRFVSGVPREDFERVKAALDSPDAPFSKSTVEEVDFRYSGAIRATYVGSEEEVEKRMNAGSDPNKVIEKRLRRVVDIVNGNCRVAFTEELPSSTADIVRNPENGTRGGYGIIMSETSSVGYESKRVKKRTSYVPSEGMWILDLTAVHRWSVLDDELRDCGDQYEIEMELTPAALSQIVDLPYDKKDAFCRALADAVFGQAGVISQMLTRVNLMAHFAAPDVLMEVNGVLLNTEERYTHRMSIQSLFATESSTNPSRFPGSLPVNFRRRHWPLVQSKPYFVSEKTDGIRHLLYICNLGVFLVNRSMDFYKVYDFDGLIDMFSAGATGPTLLDGEVVRHVDSKKLVYLIFDVVTYRGISCKDQLLSHRLPIIGEVVSKYREALTSGRLHPEPQLPFSLIGKVFEKKENIARILTQHVRLDTLSGERVYQDARRRHRTDGIIFSPDEPYSTFTVENLYKWKYVDKLTIDFRVREKSSNRFTFLYKGDTEDLWLDAEMSKDDLQKLFFDLVSYNISLLDGPIVECSYDTEYGMWKYHGIRKDKTTPNHASIVLETILSLTENVDSEEMCYRLPMTAGMDDWMKREKKKEPSLALTL